MSINEIHLTVVGRIGSEPDLKAIGQVPHLSFRLASTPRQFDKILGRFVDKTTSWLPVECWRVLAQNAFDSMRVGQPVIVTGKLRTHEWTDDQGEQRSRLILEASSIGHDLNRGTATFSKSAPRGEHTVPEVTVAPFPADEYVATPLPPQSEAA
ncbi:single-stranded DNA-binding protein [Kribbella sp. NPDC051586]|uniref:single-stranded DNA-binding protein n=1 Tax=Kribbella sp. NPDC051586 TaxID=3364118 RepID=UPI0037A73371